MEGSARDHKENIVETRNVVSLSGSTYVKKFLSGIAPMPTYLLVSEMTYYVSSGTLNSTNSSNYVRSNEHADTMRSKLDGDRTVTHAVHKSAIAYFWPVTCIIPSDDLVQNSSHVSCTMQFTSYKFRSSWFTLFC